MSSPALATDEISFNGAPYASQRASTLGFGPAFFGLMIQFYLYGIFITNLFDYLHRRNYKTDSRSKRVLLWTVVVLNSFATGTDAYLAMYHACNQNRSLMELYQVGIVDGWRCLPVGALGAIVQTFLTIRASRLFMHSATARITFLVTFLAAIVISALACAVLELHSYAFHFGWVHKLSPVNFNVLAAVWLWLSAAVDVGLTATLILCLRKSILGFNKATDNAVRNVMRAALQSAAPTAVFGVVGAILNVAWGARNNEYTGMFEIAATPLAAVYSLSLLTTLASRKPLKRATAIVSSAAISSRASVERPTRPSLARRTVSKMSIPSIHPRAESTDRSNPAGGITFTRDVVEEVEVADEFAPRVDRRPYLESYGRSI